MFSTSLIISALLAIHANALDAPTAGLDGFGQWVSPLTDTTLTNQEIELQGMVPDWLAGDYINACPSLFKVGKY
jgi:hypothetical protein